MSMAMNDHNSPAASIILGCVEVLERILQHVPPTDLPRVQQVSRHLKSVIGGSRQLQRALWREADSTLKAEKDEGTHSSNLHVNPWLAPYFASICYWNESALLENSISAYIDCGQYVELHRKLTSMGTSWHDRILLQPMPKSAEIFHLQIIGQGGIQLHLLDIDTSKNKITVGDLVNGAWPDPQKVIEEDKLRLKAWDAVTKLLPAAWEDDSDD